MTSDLKFEGLKFLAVICLVGLFLSACVSSASDPGNSINSAISAAETDTSQLATQVMDLGQDDARQDELISDLSTKMASVIQGPTKTPTPLQLDDAPTPFPVCTPPACAADEMYYCPGDCPGGCGTTCATATPGPASGIGQVWGEICFPGGTNPEMTIFFYETTAQYFLSYPFAASQETYQYEIPAGVYLAFAWLPDKEAGGGFTQFVECGKTLLSCTDHSLVPFLVRESHVSTSIDICDWETDQIDFPFTPQE